MANIPKRVEERIKAEFKKYQNILQTAKTKDINESDTVVIVSNILSDILGYDKFFEVTTEFCIRGTYCDLAVKTDKKVHFLVEVKAIGQDLKEHHLKQAIDYAANQGVDWAVLTNGIVWQAYKIFFNKPINSEKVFEVNLLEASLKDDSLLEKLYLLSKEGISKSAIVEYHEEKQATNRYILTALILSDQIIDDIRRELRKMSKAVKLDNDELRELLKNEVFKREVLEEEKAKEAVQKIKRFYSSVQKKQSIETKEEMGESGVAPSEGEQQPA